MNRFINMIIYSRFTRIPAKKLKIAVKINQPVFGGNIIEVKAWNTLKYTVWYTRSLEKSKKSQCNDRWWRRMQFRVRMQVTGHLGSTCQSSRVPILSEIRFRYRESSFLLLIYLLLFNRL